MKPNEKEQRFLSLQILKDLMVKVLPVNTVSKSTAVVPRVFKVLAAQVMKSVVSPIVMVTSCCCSNFKV